MIDHRHTSLWGRKFANSVGQSHDSFLHQRFLIPLTHLPFMAPKGDSNLTKLKVHQFGKIFTGLFGISETTFNIYLPSSGKLVTITTHTEMQLPFLNWVKSIKSPFSPLDVNQAIKDSGYTDPCRRKLAISRVGHTCSLQNPELTFSLQTCIITPFWDTNLTKFQVHWS